jgi:ArsR family transcriptional regulator, arsenate/arsenite/antimonite-responsive transcriptional repressor / arsenate reductase (thioredoxin)
VGDTDGRQDRHERGQRHDRARLHAALGEAVRLAIVEELIRSDRTPSELARRAGIASNLLAHHLAVLEEIGLLERTVSSGDRRRRYVRLRHDRLDDLAVGVPLPGRSAAFVCTHNSARSQLAAALWRARTGGRATSAGTRPAAAIHPGAIAAARRAGLPLEEGRPRLLEPDDLRADLVVTVCDRAHEELERPGDRLHWSIPDPADTGDRAAFDDALVALDDRITSITGLPHPPNPPRSER